jgi:hypothetical protein
MMKPTKDKELKKELQKILDQADCETENCNNCKFFSGKGGNDCEAPEITDQVLKLFEDKGYHVGLPSDIEWALNSGDGVYRP